MKKIVLYSIAFFIGVSICSIGIFMYGLRNIHNATIVDINRQYYYAQSLIVFGDTVIGYISDSSSSTKDIDKLPTSLKIIPTATIAHIYLHPFASPRVAAQYLGTYHINASGHEGILVLYLKDGILRGSIRFPQWANGVWEPLKDLSIKNNVIRFTRSVTNEKEMRYTGAREYFVQQYEGTYKDNGKRIIGFYTSKGAKYLFEGYRKK